MIYSMAWNLLGLMLLILIFCIAIGRLRGVKELREGDKIMIYEDPVGKTMPEGEVTLRKFIHHFHGVPESELWEVQYQNGDIRNRRIFI